MCKNGISDTNETKALGSDYPRTIFETSIRSHETTPDPIQLGFFENPLEVYDTNVVMKASTLSRNISKNGDPICASIHQAIISSFPSYGGKVFNVTGVQVFMSNVSNKPFAYAKTNCKWCLNKNGAHDSSTIFFYITPYVMHQRCFSHKTYSHGLCSKFSSEHIQTPSDLVNQMFPDWKPVKKRKKPCNSFICKEGIHDSFSKATGHIHDDDYMLK
jgi:hypothetical protein